MLTGLVDGARGAMHRSGRAAWREGQALSLWSGGRSQCFSARRRIVAWRARAGRATMLMMLWIRERAHHLLAAATWELGEDDRRDWAGKAGQRGGVGGQGGSEECSFKSRKQKSGVNVQNSKLPRLEAEDGEEGEADDKESERGQVEAAEEEKTVPATYCRPASAHFLG